MNKSIYVGMALTHAPADYRDVFQVELKEKLRLIPNVKVLDFFWVAHGEHAGTNPEVYQWDKDQTEMADLFIAMIDYPSLGLGMEIMIRHQSNKPVLFFLEQERRASRMLLGLIEQSGNVLHEYQSVDDIIQVVVDQLECVRV